MNNLDQKIDKYRALLEAQYMKMKTEGLYCCTNAVYEISKALDELILQKLIQMEADQKNKNFI